jgi:hypothetical protein
MDLAPLHTIAIGVRPKADKSAEISNEVSPPRWTPPMPPVANISIPAACAQ